MLTRALVLTAVFLGAMGFIARASHAEPTPIRQTFATFPFDIDGWRGRQDPPLDDKVLAILGVDDYLSRTYFNTGRSVAGLYVGFWRSQREGDTIHSPLNCLPGSGWEPLSKSFLTIDVPAAAGGPARPISVNRYLIQKGLDRQLVLYWYQSHGRVVASEYTSKFFLVKDAIQLNRTDAALVRVITPVVVNDEQGEAGAEANGIRFVKSLFPVLGRYLPS